MSQVLCDQLLGLYDFTCWARNRILEQAQGLSLEQFEQDSRFPLNSLKETLVHTYAAEWAYHRRMSGQAVADFPKAEVFADVLAVQDAWQEEEGQLRSYLASLDDAMLTGVVKYSNSRGEEFERVRVDLLYQLFFHSAQHRAELAQMLTEFDRSPGDLDYALYVREKLAA